MTLCPRLRLFLLATKARGRRGCPFHLQMYSIPGENMRQRACSVSISSSSIQARSPAAAIEMARVARKSGRKHESSALNGFQHQIRQKVLPADIAISKTAREVW